MRIISSLLPVMLLGATAAFGQVTLMVSPSAISNTYTGVITLNVTGLTNTEKVTVAEWLDLNGNGTVDVGEPLMDAFRINDNDNSRAIIGGITNINVPFDLNAATGAITATLNFAPPLVLENIVGQRIFQVISPTGTATATLDVTNAATGQSLTGTVYSNGVPLPNAVVVALPGQNGYAGATIADAGGHYVLSLNQGNYLVTSALPGLLVDQSTSPQVALTNGVTATNDFHLTNGTVTISGQVYDAGDSNGVPGYMLQLSSGSLFTIAFADTNGNYSALVTPNFWKIKPIKERSARRAYVVPQDGLQVDTTGGNVTNANLTFYRGNALFYGRITDAASHPFANIEFDCSDTNNLYNAKGYSDPNGNYADVAYADGTNSWNSNPDDSANTALAGDIVNNSLNTNLAPGQVVLQNYIALPGNASISGHVRDNFGNAVVAVPLYASTIGTGYGSLNAETDTNGNYTLGVATGAGQWQVNFTYGPSHDLPHQGLVDLYGPYSVAIPPTNAVLNITVYTNGSSALGQAQFIPPQQISFNAVGSPMTSYTLQYSTNLAAGWSPLYSFQITNNSPVLITDPNATNGTRFYRLQKN